MPETWTIRWHEWSGRWREKTVDYLTPLYEVALLPRARDVPAGCLCGRVTRLMRPIGPPDENRTVTLASCAEYWE